MHSIRRATFRAVASPAASFSCKSRSITTSSPFLLRSKIQSSVSTSVFRRFNSDDAYEKKVESADGGEQGAVKSALDSVSETASSFASSAAAATGFAPRRGYERSPRSSESGGGIGRPTVSRDLVPTTSIYIGNLLFDVTSNDLIREFEQYGTIKSAIIASDARGLSKGFGYVEFSSIPEATAAIEARHQSVMEGRRLVVNYMAKTHRESTPNPPSKTLFIGNLAFEMSDADLNKLFRDIKNVIDVRVAIDRRTGQPRGFAHADFVDVDSAVKGFEALQGKEIYGRRLRVDYSAGRGSPERV